MPRVLNKKIHDLPSGSVYIGRPSKWGNPYSIGANRTREQAVELYEKMICDSPLMNDINELRGKDLICWCAPQPCHGDILLRMANK